MPQYDGKVVGAVREEKIEAESYLDGNEICARRQQQGKYSEVITNIAKATANHTNALSKTLRYKNTRTHRTASFEYTKRAETSLQNQGQTVFIQSEKEAE